jgi:hypothetical protein
MVSALKLRLMAPHGIRKIDLQTAGRTFYPKKCVQRWSPVCCQLKIAEIPNEKPGGPGTPAMGNRRARRRLFGRRETRFHQASETLESRIIAGSRSAL